MDKDKVMFALKVIDHAQQEVWNLHHFVRQYSETLAEKLWEQSIQIESALVKLNDELMGKNGYFDSMVDSTKENKQ